MFVAVLPGCSPARLAEAARVLDDIDAGSGPSQLKEQTPPPRREAVSYGAYGSGNGSGAFGGDLYSSTEPGLPGLAGMVLVPG
ncbi:MAG: hypothetical protein QF592_03965, partial [Alphaproteobacteria bacterium]|nr:hypothetical protein [Alphaproteobacteria bacterium]